MRPPVYETPLSSNATLDHTSTESQALQTGGFDHRPLAPPRCHQLGSRRRRCCLLAAHAEPAKPNFIFVIADDHRWDAMGVVQREQGERARFPWFESPAMDRLAAEGVRFRRVFVVHSICSPGRAAFLTGQYNHVNGVTHNHTPLPEDSVTHATLLRDAGYLTAYFGKWRMGNQNGPQPGRRRRGHPAAAGRTQPPRGEIRIPAAGRGRVARTMNPSHQTTAMISLVWNPANETWQLF